MRFVHHAQQVASPYFSNIIFCISFFQKTHSDVYQLVACPAADQFAVTVEVGTDPDVVDPDQVHDMVDVADRIAQRRFFGIFVDESFVEAYLCDASLFGQCFQLFVRQVARMVAKRAGGRV